MHCSKLSPFGQKCQRKGARRQRPRSRNGPLRSCGLPCASCHHIMYLLSSPTRPETALRNWYMRSCWGPTVFIFAVLVSFFASPLVSPPPAGSTLITSLQTLVFLLGWVDLLPRPSHWRLATYGETAAFIFCLAGPRASIPARDTTSEGRVVDAPWGQRRAGLRPSYFQGCLLRPTGIRGYLSRYP